MAIELIIPEKIRIYPGNCCVCGEPDGIVKWYTENEPMRLVRRVEWDPSITIDPTQHIGMAFAFSPCGHTIHDYCWRKWVGESKREVETCFVCRKFIDTRLIPPELPAPLWAKVDAAHSAAYIEGYPKLSIVSSVIVVGTGTLYVSLVSWVKSDRESRYFAFFNKNRELNKDPRNTEKVDFIDPRTVKVNIDPRIYGSEGFGYKLNIWQLPMDSHYLLQYKEEVIWVKDPGDWRHTFFSCADAIYFPGNDGSSWFSFPELQFYPLILPAMSFNEWEASYYAPHTPIFLAIRIMAVYLAYRAVRNIGEHRFVRRLAGGVAARRVEFNHYCLPVLKNIWKKLVG